MTDLHTHTTMSDGLDEPAALLERARREGLSAIAITDHDTLLGWDAAREANGNGVRLVCGIELSTRDLTESWQVRRPVHVLGYFFPEPAAGFRQWLESLREKRRTRNREIARKLQSFGMDVPIEEVEKLGRNVAGRPHFARIMLEKGFVRTWEEAFTVYLGEEGKAYVERQDPSVEEGVQRIRAAGGAPVLAHPVRLRRSPDDEAKLLTRMKDAGLCGLESYHPDQKGGCAERYVRVAAKFGLVPTAGSDFHGRPSPAPKLGSSSAVLGDDVVDRLSRCAADGE
jgi:hypothetical protein